MPGPQAAWFTPERLLFLFCCMSLLVYVDRGACRLPGAWLLQAVSVLDREESHAMFHGFETAFSG